MVKHMENKLHVMLAFFEAVPFMKTGGLGDVGGSLPGALKRAGVDARAVMPKFSGIAEKYKKKMRHVTDFRLSLGWRNQYCGVESLKQDGTTYYFIDNEYYFARDKAYGYYDDGERIAFFAKAVCEFLQYLPDFRCDILHCSDWHTALSPVFLREFYGALPEYRHIRTVFTVHNLKFQGQMSDYVLGDVLGLADIPAARDQLSDVGDSVNFMKGALLYSDILTTVSPTYAEEIRTPYYGERMDGIFRDRASVLYGILNGIDTKDYDPETDPEVPYHFSLSDRSGKKACKAALQRELGLPEEPDKPLIIMIGRLTQQKGLDLLAAVISELLDQDLQLAVLGTGDAEYENMMKSISYSRPNMADRICFDEALSRRMYAGADMLLMPSQFEPCGLSQMIAMRYGTLPVVRETGGLKDSVIPYNRYTGEGTGFSFANYNAHEMLFTIKDAARIYREEPDTWQALMDNAMKEDFSWDRSAEKYKEIYEKLCPEGGA